MNMNDLDRYHRIQEQLSHYGLTARRSDRFYDRICIGPLNNESCPPFSEGAQLVVLQSFEEVETWLMGFQNASMVFAALGFDRKKVTKAQDRLRKQQLMDTLAQQESEGTNK